MARKVRVTVVYEQNEEDFEPDGFLDFDASRFEHVTNGEWPPQTMEQMAKIDELSGDFPGDIGYEKVSSTWEIIDGVS